MIARLPLKPTEELNNKNQINEYNKKNFKSKNKDENKT